MADVRTVHFSIAMPSIHFSIAMPSIHFSIAMLKHWLMHVVYILILLHCYAEAFGSCMWCTFSFFYIAMLKHSVNACSIHVYCGLFTLLCCNAKVLHTQSAML